MKALQDILSDKEYASPMLRGAKAALTVEEANQILKNLFGSACPKYAEAVYLRKGVLHIQIKGSSAAAEIRMNQDKILAEISKKYGSKAVTGIRFEI